VINHGLPRHALLYDTRLLIESNDDKDDVEGYGAFGFAMALGLMFLLFLQHVYSTRGSCCPGLSARTEGIAWIPIRRTMHIITVILFTMRWVLMTINSSKRLLPLSRQQHA